MAQLRSEWPVVRMLIVGLRDGEGSRFRALRDAIQGRFFDEEQWTLEAVLAESVTEAVERLGLGRRERFDVLYLAHEEPGNGVGWGVAKRLVETCVAHNERPVVLIAFEYAVLASLFRDAGIPAEISATRGALVSAVKRQRADLADKQNIS